MKIHTPFSTALSGNARETELRLRSIFQWKKKRPPVLILLLILTLALGCGGLVACRKQQTDVPPVPDADAPAGRIAFCVPQDAEHYFLLYDNAVQTDKTLPPVHENHFCLYDRKTQDCTPLCSREGWLYAPYSPAAADGNRLFFGTGDQLYQLRRNGKDWEIAASDTVRSGPFAVSPDGLRCALAQNNGVSVLSLADGGGLARLSGLAEIRQLNWSADGRRLCIQNGQNAVVWDAEQDQCFRYFTDGEAFPDYEAAVWRAAQKAGIRMSMADTLADMGYELDEIARMSPEEADALLTQGLSPDEVRRYEAEKAVPRAAAPERWVDTVGVRCAGEKYLIVEYLCETETVFVLWDMDQNLRTDELHTGGDAVILDMQGEMLLYTCRADGKKESTLHLYDCASGQDRILHRVQGFHTAACFGPDGGILACTYAPETGAAVVPLS